jgi:hypothetical protein
LERIFFVEGKDTLLLALLKICFFDMLLWSPALVANIVL